MIISGFTYSIQFDYLKLMYFTTANQFVLLILMIDKCYQLAFEKKKKKREIEAEVYEISGKNPLKRPLVSGS